MVRVQASSNRFFKDLEGKVKKAALTAARDHAYVMRDILRYRKSMYKGSSDNARYPRWKGGKPKSYSGPHSYTGWSLEEKGDKFTLTNNVANSNDGFEYPRILMRGVPVDKAPNGWKDAAITGVKVDGTPTKLVKHYGKIFSSQLPRGVNPWLKKQKADMEHKIKQAIGAVK